MAHVFSFLVSFLSSITRHSGGVTKNNEDFTVGCLVVNRL